MSNKFSLAKCITMLVNTFEKVLHAGHDVQVQLWVQVNAWAVQEVLSAYQYFKETYDTILCQHTTNTSTKLSPVQVSVIIQKATT